MKFYTQVRKWGGSLAVIIPKEIVEKLSLKEGSWVKVEVEVAE